MANIYIYTSCIACTEAAITIGCAKSRLGQDKSVELPYKRLDSILV